MHRREELIGVVLVGVLGIERNQFLQRRLCLLPLAVGQKTARLQGQGPETVGMLAEPLGDRLRIGRVELLAGRLLPVHSRRESLGTLLGKGFEFRLQLVQRAGVFD